MEIAGFINRKRLIETFTDLISVNSPSFGEREIGGVLVSKLKEAGCIVETQEYDRSFNIIAFKKGDIDAAPAILLSAHMDTIEPTSGIVFSVDNEKIRTTGGTVLGADDKSALAQIIEALTVIHERGLSHGDIEIAFSSAEETGLVGAKNLDIGRLRSKHALVLDSSGPVGKIVTGAPTHLTYEMVVTGRSAHAGIEPEKGNNAIRVASMIVSEVPDGRIDRETTANIGTISGGTATNVVPREVVIRGEVRSHSTGKMEEARSAIFRIAREVAARNQARIHIAEEVEYHAFRVPENGRFLKFMEGVFGECGIGPACAVTGGGSDANIFHQHGIEAINISTGMQNVHSAEEYIDIRDLLDGCLVTLKAATEFGRAMKAG